MSEVGRRTARKKKGRAGEGKKLSGRRFSTLSSVRAKLSTKDDVVVHHSGHVHTKVL